MAKHEKNIKCGRCNIVHLPSVPCWDVIKNAQAKYRIDIFQDNRWVRWGSHKTLSDALYSAGRVYGAKNCDVRVIHRGVIVASTIEGKTIGDLRPGL